MKQHNKELLERLQGQITTTEIHLASGTIKAPVLTYNRSKAVFPAKVPVFMAQPKGKHKKGYYKLYCGFDIETTNVITNDAKKAFMYIWQFAIASDKEGFVYIGRTWAEFVDLINQLNEFYQTDETRKIIIFDANFGFEFQFIRYLLNWKNDDYAFFAKEERKPLLATVGNIEFREALSITGGGLAQLAKEYTTTQKLVGDLDYTIQRNNKSKLDLTELQYCINDVVILAEFSDFIFRAYIIPSHRVPLTKTGLLRAEVKEELAKQCKRIEDYKAAIKTAFPTETEYKMYFRYLFRGGYVHSNFTLTNQILKGCRAFDITSSYPARMNLSYYPVTPFVPEEFNTEALKTKCCIMIAEFYNIRNTTFHSIESGHKVIEGEEIKLDNGRVYRAKRMRVMLTELDLVNYCNYYLWDDMKIISFKTAKRGKLPRFIRDVLNRHYKKKAALKAQGLNDTPEYAIVKSGVNSAFGLMVTRISLDKVIFKDGQWMLDPVPLDYNKEIEGQFLLPQWGIYVAAAARHELLNMVWEIERVCGNIVIYCDTDSIKCLDHPKLDGIIEGYNLQIEKQLKKVQLTDPAFADLGFFDDEAKGHIITRFKTLGAKRYLTEYDNKKIKATIAGLPKATILKQGVDPFKLFDVDGMEIAAENSGKLTTCYNDTYTCAWVAGEFMEEQSSVALYEIPFTMFTDKEYYNLLFDPAMMRSKL